MRYNSHIGTKKQGNEMNSYLKKLLDEMEKEAQHAQTCPTH